MKWQLKEFIQKKHPCEKSKSNEREVYSILPIQKTYEFNVFFEILGFTPKGQTIFKNEFREIYIYDNQKTNYMICCYKNKENTSFDSKRDGLRSLDD